MIMRQGSHVRAVVVAVVGLAIVFTSVSASAATKKKHKHARPKPKPVCNLVTDPKGDVATGDAALDIVSADVATNATTITGVIRVAKLSSPDVMAPEGMFFQFNFTGSAGQTGQHLDAQLLPTGNVFQGGAGTGVVDLAKSEIRISVPLSQWTAASTIVPGPPFHNFIVYADHGNPVVAAPDSFTFAGDTATGKTTYTPGTPSCVAVGK
jgi:hypothetical protein